MDETTRKIRNLLVRFTQGMDGLLGVAGIIFRTRPIFSTARGLFHLGVEEWPRREIGLLELDIDTGFMKKHED